MAKENYDFWGWATRNNLKCSDGRTIRHNAFKDCDGSTVPLVWNHQHNDPDNILGHAILKNTDEGVKAYGFFNDTPKSQRVKTSLQHGDITSLSIFANKLKQTPNGDVLHGIIREVSLVLAGANPGASIEYVMAHSDDEDPIAVGAEIYSGEDLVLVHKANSGEIEIVDDPEEDEEEEKVEEKDEEKESEAEAEEESKSEEKPEEEEQEESKEDKKELAHADKAEEDKEEKEEVKEQMADNKEKTVQDVLDSMTPEQRKVTEYLVGEALASVEDNSDEGDKEVKHNAFDDNAGYNQEDELIHSAIVESFKDAKTYGTMRESLKHHDLNPEEVLVHGVEHVDYLFPENRLVDNKIPFMNINPDGWVSVVLNGVHKTPYARVKSILADIRDNDARARGYVKGAKKKDEVIKLLKRAINPTTIYKKQAIDRDDIIDLEEGNIDFISMVKDEMKVKWDEEFARAVLFSDGRSVADEDKIDESCIVPVAKDTVENVYAMEFEVAPQSNETEAHAIINTSVKAMNDYQGSGNITAFIKADKVTDLILQEDKFGHRLYKNMDELASAMLVNKIVKVPSSIVPAGLIGVMLDLSDYNVGANRQGERSLFDDFDIDYNKQKYLLEGRRSGGLYKPHSAIVLKEAAAAAVQDGDLDAPVDDES